MYLIPFYDYCVIWDWRMCVCLPWTLSIFISNWFRFVFGSLVFVSSHHLYTHKLSLSEPRWNFNTNSSTSICSSTKVHFIYSFCSLFLVFHCVTRWNESYSCVHWHASKKRKNQNLNKFSFEFFSLALFSRPHSMRHVRWIGQSMFRLHARTHWHLSKIWPLNVRYHGWVQPKAMNV